MSKKLFSEICPDQFRFEVSFFFLWPFKIILPNAKKKNVRENQENHQNVSKPKLLKEQAENDANLLRGFVVFDRNGESWGMQELVSAEIWSNSCRSNQREEHQRAHCDWWRQTLIKKRRHWSSRQRALGQWEREARCQSWRVLLPLCYSAKAAAQQHSSVQ